MKKLLFLSLALFLFSSSVTADDFSPTLLTLDVPEEFRYIFDGSIAKIPVTVGGTPAAVWLVISTQGKGERIGEVTNGHLGWHYVNNIDTTMYISPKYSFSPGEQVIEWDGTDSNGNRLEKSVYTYYLWGYDDQSPRQMACDYITLSHDWQPAMMKLFAFGSNKMPLANPIFFGNPPWYEQSEIGGQVSRWRLGGDPYDENLLETTTCPIYSSSEYADEPGFLSIGFPALDPNYDDIFYQPCRDNDKAILNMHKWTFVNDGDAILDDDWGEWEPYYVFDCPSMADSPDPWIRDSGVYTDTQYLYLTGQSGGQRKWNYIYIIDFEGELVNAINHEEMNMPNDPGKPDDDTGEIAVNSDPYLMDWLQIRNNTWVFWGNSCLQECVDYTAALSGYDYQILWQNKNGDFFFDHGYAPNAEYPWFCIGGNAELGETQGRHTSLNVDSMGFNIWGTGQYGLANFGVSTQDGTAIGYMHFADEALDDPSTRKGGGTICDNGGKFDGMYWPYSDPFAGGMWFPAKNAMFIGMDNARGVIHDCYPCEPDNISDEDNTSEQIEFTLTQNSPNPFNPFTTIRYSIPDDTKVSLKIYTISGQHVATLKDGIEAAGQHSVSWDASGLPSGIYLYTLEAGNYEKTRKMTLVK